AGADLRLLVRVVDTELLIELGQRRLLPSRQFPPLARLNQGPSNERGQLAEGRRITEACRLKAAFDGAALGGATRGLALGLSFFQLFAEIAKQRLLEDLAYADRANAVVLGQVAALPEERQGVLGKVFQPACGLLVGGGEGDLLAQHFRSLRFARPWVSQ